jgi:hypothetical protein
MAAASNSLNRPTAGELVSEPQEQEFPQGNSCPRAFKQIEFERRETADSEAQFGRTNEQPEKPPLLSNGAESEYVTCQHKHLDLYPVAYFRPTAV